MTWFVRRLFSPSTAARRLFSGLCGAFLLLSILLSSVFVVAESDHDCSGHDCPVCIQIQTCLDGFQQTGMPIPPDVPSISCDPVPCEHFCARVYRAPATTLQSLDVRFDE